MDRMMEYCPKIPPQYGDREDIKYRLTEALNAIDKMYDDDMNNRYLLSLHERLISGRKYFSNRCRELE
jgi:hypothetical protein